MHKIWSVRHSAANSQVWSPTPTAPGEPVLPWIYAIARHARVDSYRRSQRIRSREQAMAPLPEYADSSQPFAAPESDRRDDRGPAPGQQREVVSMLKLSGMSLKRSCEPPPPVGAAVKQKGGTAHKGTLRGKLAGRGPGKTSEEWREMPVDELDRPASRVSAPGLHRVPGSASNISTPANAARVVAGSAGRRRRQVEFPET